MSLHVDREKVSAVLLADGWHTVLDHSFDLDAYEYHDEDRLNLQGGQVTGIPSTGATWLDKESGAYIVCPNLHRVARGGGKGMLHARN